MLILAYHRVQPSPTDTLSVSSPNFERQLHWLRLTGWRPASASGLDSDRRAFAVTFDDGYQDNHEYAVPILRRLDIPATFFISTGFVDAKHVFPWRAERIAPDDDMALPM